MIGGRAGARRGIGAVSGGRLGDERRLTSWMETLAVCVAEAATERGVPELPELPRRSHMYRAATEPPRLIGSGAWRARVQGISVVDEPDPHVAAALTAVAV